MRELARTTAKKSGKVFSSGSVRRCNRSTFNYIAVTLAMDWPSSDAGRPLNPQLLSATNLQFLSEASSQQLAASLQESTEGKPHLLSDTFKLAVVGSALFRLQICIEQALHSRVQLLDIRTGCIRVRFKLPDNIDEYVVRHALTTLQDRREIYDVMHSSGHIKGKDISL